LSWNFQGLRFYRGSNFTFSYRFFHGPYNSAALLRCLWLAVIGLKNWHPLMLTPKIRPSLRLSPLPPNGRRPVRDVAEPPCRISRRSVKLRLRNPLPYTNKNQVRQLSGLAYIHTMSIAVTSQGHQNWSPSAFCVIFVMSNIVTVAVLDIFHVKNMTLVFDPSRSSKVKSDGANQKLVDPTYKCFRGVQPHIFHRSRDISSQSFDVDLLRVVGVTPGPKFTKRGDDVLPAKIYRPAKTSSPCVDARRRYPLQSCCGQTNKLIQKHGNRKRYLPPCLSACEIKAKKAQ